PVAPVGAGDCDPNTDSCTVRISIVVDEGQPLQVGRGEGSGLGTLPAGGRGRGLEGALLERGGGFGERDYDRGEQVLVGTLAEESYADAKVKGQVRLDHANKLAHASFEVELGPAYRFGEVRVQGQGRLPAAPIAAAAGIERGLPYRQSALAEVQREV